jgi:hypothetical protein
MKKLIVPLLVAAGFIALTTIDLPPKKWTGLSCF